MPNEIDELEALVRGVAPVEPGAGPPGPPGPPGAPSLWDRWKSGVAAQWEDLTSHTPAENLERIPGMGALEAVVGAPKAAVDWAAQQAGYRTAGEAARTHPYLTAAAAPEIGMVLSGSQGASEALDELGHPRAAAFFRGAASHGAELATDPLMWVGAVAAKLPLAGKALQILLAKGLTDTVYSAYKEFEANGASAAFWSIVGGAGVDLGTIGGLHLLTRGARPTQAEGVPGPAETGRPETTAPTAPEAPSAALGAVDPAAFLSEFQASLLTRRSGPHASEALTAAKEALATLGEAAPLQPVDAADIPNVLRNLGWSNERLRQANRSEMDAALQEVGLKPPEIPRPTAAADAEPRLSDAELEKLIEQLSRPSDEFVLGEHPKWEEIKSAVRDFEANNPTRSVPRQTITEAAKALEDSLPEANRKDAARQFEMLYEARETGSEWLDQFQREHETSLGKASPDQTYTDQKTGLQVLRWGRDPKASRYLVLDPQTGQVEAGAETYRGKISHIVGGSRIMDRLPGSSGALYRTLKSEGIENAMVTLPAGRAAQIRAGRAAHWAGRAGLDISGALPILEGREGGGGERVAPVPRLNGPPDAQAARQPERLGGDEAVRSGAPEAAAGGRAGGPPEAPGEPAGVAREGAAPEVDRGIPPTAGNFLARPEPAAAPGVPPEGPPGPPGAPEAPAPPLPWAHLTEPILRQAFHQEVTRVAEEVMRQAGISWDHTRFPVLSDQLAAQINDGTIPLPTLVDAVQRGGMTLTEFTSQLWRPAVTDAAQRLQALSTLARRLHQVEATASPGVRDALSKAAEGLGTQLDEFALARSWGRRLDNVRRGLLVSQLSTNQRNIIGQLGRLGVGALTDSMDYALQSALKGIGVNIQPNVHPLEGWRILGQSAWGIVSFGKAEPARRAKAMTEFLLGDASKNIPGIFDSKFGDRLFNIYASDVSTGIENHGLVVRGVDKVFSHLERAVDVVNTLNRGQEYIFRRAVFTGKLDGEIRARGGSGLADAIDAHNQLVQDLEGRYGKDWKHNAEAGSAFVSDPRNLLKVVDEGMLSRTIQKALEYTFAETPKWGTAGHAFIQAINRIPGLTLILPFPRFMINGLKFTFDYNPTGLLRLLSSAEMAKVKAGDTTVISKAAIGIGMLLAAYAIRKSDDAGERWYQVNVRLPGSDKTRTIDIRPFNPFAAHFFIADLLVRKQEDRLYQLSSQDILEGIASTNLRAGTGLALLNSVMQGATSLGSGPELGNALARFGGEYISSFLTPLQTLTDFVAQFDRDSRIVRDRRVDPFWGPIAGRFPLASRGKPELELPTREAPPENEFPLLKQATGLLISDPQNPLEHELARLQFSPGEVFQGSRSGEADALVKHYMGQFAEDELVPIVQSAEYRGLTDREKGYYLADLMSMVRRSARGVAMAERPDLFSGMHHKSIRQQLLEQEEESLSGPPGPPS
jgi:hypothetical protein